MQFRTEIPIHKLPFTINHQTPLLFLGSCFSEHLGNYLKQHYFSVSQNPFGITYNPLSIAQQLQKLMAGTGVMAADLFENQGLFHHYDFHGSFSHPEVGSAVQNMNNSLNYAGSFLKKTTVVFVSLGTAYTWFCNNKNVNNCHKMPASNFTHKMVTTAQWVAAFEPVLQQLFESNPNVQVVFTVSPVRHTNKGMAANNLSKATLLLGIVELVTTFPQAHYLPVYEWVIDDLRDYRFFEADLVHPNALAVQYVSEKFAATFFDATTQVHVSELRRILKTLQHKPFHGGTEAYQNLQEKTKFELQQYLEKLGVQKAKY